MPGVVGQSGTTIGCSGSGITHGPSQPIMVRELVPIVLALAVWGNQWQYLGEYLEFRR